MIIPVPTTTSLPLSSDEPGAVAIVASAGGIPGLLKLLAALPPDFPLPVLVTQHLSATAPSLLVDLLARKASLHVQWAEAGERPRAGTIQVARPGHQIEVSAAGLVVTLLAPRPSAWLASADALLESVAATYGGKSIGIVLSGMLAAGVRGLRAIRRRGGLVLAESESSATHFSMPMSAIDLGKADIVYPVDRMAEALVAFTEFQAEPYRPLRANGGSRSIDRQ